jgi:hypothetical protein
MDLEQHHLSDVENQPILHGAFSQTLFQQYFLEIPR